MGGIREVPGQRAAAIQAVPRTLSLALSREKAPPPQRGVLALRSSSVSANVPKQVCCYAHMGDSCNATERPEAGFLVCATAGYARVQLPDHQGNVPRAPPALKNGMGKHKGKGSSRSSSKQQDEPTKKGSATTQKAGPSRVFLLRHGQSEANAQRIDVPDPLLTDLGRMQASAWKGAIGRFAVETVLVSPLRRAIQTALLAYDGVDVHIEACRHAREMWWDEKANWPAKSPAELDSLLKSLPRGGDVCCLEMALESADVPQSERDSIRALKEELASRPEDSVCIVCHWGVINALTGENADNCELVECKRTSNGQFTVERQHPPPRAPKTR